jgi:hypothetical protein
MSIIMEIHGATFGTVDQYPEGTYSLIEETRRGKVTKLADPAKGYTNGNYIDVPRLEAGKPFMQQETYVGCVIELREVNGYDDSDFYARVWDDESQSIKRVEYATTRAATYGNSAFVDLTPERKALVEAHCRKEREAQIAAKAAQDFATPTKGKIVEVIAGQKLPVGTKAVVGWYGADRFDRSRRYGDRLTLNDVGIYDPEATAQRSGFRVGLRIEGEAKLVFVSAMNVKVVAAQEAVAA